MAEETLTLNHPPESSSSGRRPPPPLPPRQRSTQPTNNSPYTDPPPSYDAIADSNIAESSKSVLDQSWNAQDPRSSSTQSLTPASDNAQGTRRKLLCVYIHGFMGNETSFRSFPAHVHNLLTVLLAETHVVHTKIYPRYRSKRNISFARDDFSKWLEPHEGDMVDVVLLGHSMGGLVSAEVVLMPPAPPLSRPLKHRIIGSINFDVPFLGMHPGVVKSGLASIFAAPPEAPADKWEGTELAPTISTPDGARPTGTASPAPSHGLQHADTFWQPERPDPNYNPSFQNDVTLPMRKGWRNAWHFVNKHSDSLGKATKQLVTSHLEFGGAMANYGELKGRYARVRALEEESTAVRKSIATGNVPPPRVRFVNYYTACHGRPKVVKESPEDKQLPSGVGSKASLEVEPENAVTTSDGSTKLSRTPSPRILLEEHRDAQVETKEPVVPSNDDDDDDDDDDWQSATSTAPPGDMQHVDPAPEIEAATEPLSTSQSIPTLSHTSTGLSLTASLPPVPDPPTAPPPLDTSYIQDKDTKKLVEKEHVRSVKAYEKAVKEREKIIKDRAKLEEKRARKSLKDDEKAERDARKAREKAEKADKKSVKKEEKSEEKRELTHSEREEMRLAEERERMAREGRRMRGEPEPEPQRKPQSEPVPSSSDSESQKDDLTRTTTLSSTQPLTTTNTTATTTSSRSPSPNPSDSEAKQSKPKKAKGPPKDRKFCTLPPKDSQGERDPCWVRIFMKDVDEVGAHCGLFFVDERYERLVGDVAGRVEGWVREAGA